MAGPDISPPRATDAVLSVAQSHGEAGGPDGAEIRGRLLGEGTRYRIGERVSWAHRTRPYERLSTDPVYRPLKIFALDPSVSRLEGGIASTKVQYEPLGPGHLGSIFGVDSSEPGGGSGEATGWASSYPDDPRVLLQGGYAPSVSDPRFHQQMVYAVGMMTYAAFKVALGRNVSWAIQPPADPEIPNRLILSPFGAKEPNAWYDREAGEVIFGYFLAAAPTPIAQQGKSYVHTALSHDIIVHELTHALLDGMRAQFLIPSHPEVLAFHEAFADLIAFFQHFTFPDFVRSVLGKGRGTLGVDSAFVQFAGEFGKSLGRNGALRMLADTEHAGSGHAAAEVLTYEAALAEDPEPHSLGRVLSRAVIAAFRTVYERRSRRFVKLATGGTGALPEGDISPALQDFLVEEVRRIAGQFLGICIRAIDYCPPVDVRFGDYLRALVTADLDVVPDDDWGYRETLIQEFGRRGIYCEGCNSMTEDALAWSAPETWLDPVPQLGFGKMDFDGDPGNPSSPDELRRQAGELGNLVSHPDFASEFGLVSPGSEAFAGGGYDLPRVESIRSARRIGPDKQVTFDTVAEVVQKRRIVRDGSEFDFYGGSTVILSPVGKIRFVVRKRVDHEKLPDLQWRYMTGAGQAFWRGGARLTPAPDLARHLCAH